VPRQGLAALLALASLAAVLSGCASPGPAGVSAAGADTAGAAAPAAEEPAGQGTLVQAVKVLPHVYPIDLSGHIRPGPCLSRARYCQLGVGVQPPGQPMPASAGLEWRGVSQAYTDAEGLFWRIRLAGTWSSSTPAVEGVTLTVGTRSSSCTDCEPRVAFQDAFDGAIEVARTDVFLEPGEDTLLVWVEPMGLRGTAVWPADVQVDLHGWTAAFVPDGQPFTLSAA
jgi:hypothetical protein